MILIEDTLMVNSLLFSSLQWDTVQSLTREQDPPFVLGPHSQQYTIDFLLRTVVSDLEVLIVIPAASHSAANLSTEPTAPHRSQLPELQPDHT